MFEKNRQIIGESDVFLQVHEKASFLAKLNRPVLIIGERGTGKELVAERIHYLSKQWQERYISLNCAALSPTLLESELFGHEQGAFTGASRRKVSRFEMADRGTLFLDEVATLSQEAQKKLLRVVEYGCFERVGGTETIQVQTRLVAATNEDLPSLCERGRFRADLLDRLSFDVITLPPLRYRRKDIMLLAYHFAVKMIGELGGSQFLGFSPGVVDELEEYPWPGNVRQLKNVIERAAYRFKDEVISEVVFDPFESPYRPLAVKVENYSDEKREDEKEPGIDGVGRGFAESVKEFEISLLEQGLQRNDQNQTKTARELGLTYHQLRGLMKKYKLKS